MPRVSCGFGDSGDTSGATLLAVHGPTLLADIGFDANYDHNVGGVPQPGQQNVPALVDTGATESCIDAGLAQALDLPVVDRREYGGVGGAHELDVYMAQIHIPALNFTVYGAFAGVQLAAGGQSHLALIGRTFLQGCMLIYDGATGAVTIMK